VKRPLAEKPEERDGNDGRMESEENQTQVSLPSHRPWKSLARFPHSHRAHGFSLSQNQNRKEFPATHPIPSVQAHSSMRKCYQRFPDQRLPDSDMIGVLEQLERRLPFHIARDDSFTLGNEN